MRLESVTPLFCRKTITINWKMKTSYFCFILVLTILCLSTQESFGLPASGSDDGLTTTNHDSRFFHRIRSLMIIRRDMEKCNSTSTLILHMYLILSLFFLSFVVDSKEVNQLKEAIDDLLNTVFQDSKKL